MPAGSRSTASLLDFVFEAAGVLGLIAVLLLCMLAFAGVDGMPFWTTAAVAGFGNAVYLVHQVMRRVTGQTDIGWRAMVTITLVPALALLVAAGLAGQRAGFWHTPLGHRAVEQTQHVLTIKKDDDGQIQTEQTVSEPDRP